MTTRELIKKAEKTPATELTLSERMRIIRHLRGIWQKEAAEAAGVTQAAISSYEKNKRTPSVGIIIRLAQLYNCSLDWLCGLSENIGGKKNG